MKQWNVAILGFGVVGSGVYRILTENHDELKHREKLHLHVKRILVRELSPKRSYAPAPADCLTTCFDDILSDPDIPIIVECMGGVEPARSYLLAALKAGKTVVTSNKEVISKHWYEFEAAARSAGAGLYYEATVGGGIPLLRTIQDSMQANNIHRVMGIINGTTNYILTKMSENGGSFDAVLKEAQALGYAEADPTADVEGFDATYKLSILSSLAFHAHMPVDVIYREGITKLTKDDFAMARALNCVIKLLAIGKKEGTSIEVRVHPTLLPLTHPLAAVRGSFNAVFMTGHAVGDVMLYGRGAGCMPTASAVVSDVINACHAHGRHRHPTFVNAENMVSEIHLVKNFVSAYCVRLRVCDRVGVMARVASAFAEHNVSLRRVDQAEAASADGSPRVIFVTHQAHEDDLRSALNELKGLDCVQAVESVLRMEE